jgi:hypothetical protein
VVAKHAHAGERSSIQGAPASTQTPASKHDADELGRQRTLAADDLGRRAGARRSSGGVGRWARTRRREDEHLRRWAARGGAPAALGSARWGRCAASAAA